MNYNGMNPMKYLGIGDRHANIDYHMVKVECGARVTDAMSGAGAAGGHCRKQIN